MTQTKMTHAERFFWKNAGFSYDPAKETKAQGRRRCATALAEAESYAQDRQWSYEWEWDCEGCAGCDCGSSECACSAGTEHETLCCVLRVHRGAILASLYGICEPSADYRRVIEAELALEAQ